MIVLESILMHVLDWDLECCFGIDVNGCFGPVYTWWF